MHSNRRLLLVAAIALAAAAPAEAQAPAANFNPIVTPAWLAEHLNDPGLVVIHIGHDDYADGHIPGARNLDYGNQVTRRGTLSTELPDLADARRTFEALGVSDGSTVVVYAHEAPMATRALFTLAWLGVDRIAYLDGGLERWRAEGRAMSREVPRVTAGRITTPSRDGLVATAEWITPRLGRPGVAFVDTRTDGEYNGTGNRSGMPSAGHLEGARQLEWEDLFSDRAARLKPREELVRLFAEAAAPGDTVVTYCWVGYRASATWFIARALGYDARLYDGSYQDWSQRQLPTRQPAGRQPR